MTIRKHYRQIPRVMLVLLAAISAASQAAPFDVPGPTANNVDVVDTSPLVLNFNVLDAGVISSLGVRVALDVSGDGGTANWDNIYLQISHAGVDVVLMDLQNDILGPISSLQAEFSDGGSDLASSSIVDDLTTGTFSPQEALSAFDGLPLDGQWTLTIWDDTVPLDGTDLSGFSIFGLADSAGVPVQVVPTLPIFGLGMAMLGLLLIARRRLLKH